MAKYNELTLGQVEAIINKLGGVDGAMRFLRGKLVVSAPNKDWRDEDGVIYITVTSDGATGAEWIKRLEQEGYSIGDSYDLLTSPDFKPTSGITTEIAILKGMAFEKNQCTTENIRKAAMKKGFGIPNPEIACLLFEKFTREDFEKMGFYSIVAMHEPFKIDNDCPQYLFKQGYSGGKNFLYSHCDHTGVWDHMKGFAFIASRVKN